MLGMNSSDSLVFARFLVEEDEEADGLSSDTRRKRPPPTIAFDPNRQVNSQYVPVRLMANFTKLPTLFTHEQEMAACIKFKEAYSLKELKRLERVLNDCDDAFVDLFKFFNELRKLTVAEAAQPLTDHEVECIFVCLTRGGRTDQQLLRILDDTKRAQLAYLARGFDS